jgi:very-short-patch-repair endonuclease
MLRGLHRGVYAVGHAQLTRQGHALAAVLACGPGALLSHRSAAVAWGMTPDTDGDVHVTVVGRWSRQRPGLVVHHVDQIAPIDVTTRDSIPITSAARALIDLAATCPPRDVEKAFDEGRHRGVVGPRALAAALQRYPRRPGCALLAELIEPGRRSTRSRSGLEDDFLALIRRAGLPPAEMNGRLGVYSVDFLWRNQRVAIEIDSLKYHSSRTAFERDREKTLWLAERGFVVLRFTDHQLRYQPEMVLARVAAALARADAAVSSR